MASSNLRKELECLICLDFYKDPVILRCGHNFCRKCISGLLDIQRKSGGYSCPQCREMFPVRPTLQSNIALRNILENLISTPPDQETSGKVCSYCIHFPVPAVKYCLLCEASLCDNHVGVHSKLPEHFLCDPNTTLENRKCPIHKELLKYYCAQDDACICVSCSLIGEHRGHHVETLEVASEMKKTSLRNGLQTLMTKKEEMEKIVQRLQKNMIKVQEKADSEVERVNDLFRDLRKQLEDLKKNVLGEMTRQVESVSHKLSEEVQKLELKKDELSRKIHHIQELCNQTDPMTVLQESDVRNLCYSEDEQAHDGEDLDVSGISLLLNKGLLDIISGITLQKCTDTHDHPHAISKKRLRTADELAGQSTQPAVTKQSPQCPRKNGGPNIGIKQQPAGLSGTTDIFLDVNTAGNDLCISEDRKVVSWSDDRQKRPETPKRFQYSQVLSIQNFSSGQHCWNVEVTGAECWRVGMCYPSMERRGWPQSGIGYNNKSWGLERLWKNQYVAIHDKERVPISCNVSGNRVRIDLDYEAGQISFYDLCDPIQHLHTFTATFTEPLHVGLYVLGGRIKISGGGGDGRGLPSD